MARARMVTRTITATKCEVQIVTISASEITTINQTVSGEYEDADKLLKAVKKSVETEDIKVLKVLTSEKEEKLYGMKEEDFLKVAKELDAKTRKMLEDESEQEDTAPTQEQEQPTETKKNGKRGK